MNPEDIIYRCIIIDDEPLACGLLSDYIQKLPILNLLGTYTNPLSALSEIKKNDIDLVFLDIHMPELSGLQMAEILPPNCRVIFTTAYPDFALKGFELNATDYLLKPVSFERFLKAIQKLQPTRVHNTDAEPPLVQAAGSQQEGVIFVKADSKIIKVFLAEILFIEGLKEYVAIHTVNKKIITLQNLKKLEEALHSSRFARVHKSYIVAIDKIDSISKGRIFIRQAVIPVGESYKESFFTRLNNKDLF